MLIKKIKVEQCRAEEVPQLLQDNNVPYSVLECVNWSDSYPYKPKVEVAVAHTGKHILIHYRVSEQSVRAVALNDQDAVWEDSCVEFFSQPNAEDGIYYNVECNCAGRLLLAAGAGRGERQPAPKSVTDAISRWASLGTAPFEERKEQTTWELALVLPTAVYFKHDIKSFDGMTIRANIYKCGDKLSVPHFLSLYPISTDTPDFHRPEFFNELNFE
jgi:hypothetical protein